MRKSPEHTKITIEELRNNWDWTAVKPDLQDRITRSIHSQLDILQSCCGILTPTSLFTWFQVDMEFPYSANNISIRSSEGWMCEGERVIGKPIS